MAARTKPKPRHDSAAAAAIAAGIQSLAHLRMLELLAKSDGIPTGAFADFTGLRTGGLTQSIDSLIARGFIARRPHPTDRRYILIDLTPAGRDLVATFPR